MLSTVCLLSVDCLCTVYLLSVNCLCTTYLCVCLLSVVSTLCLWTVCSLSMYCLCTICVSAYCLSTVCSVYSLSVDCLFTVCVLSVVFLSPPGLVPYVQCTHLLDSCASTPDSSLLHCLPVPRCSNRMSAEQALQSMWLTVSVAHSCLNW